MMAREVVARIRKLLLILCDPLYRGALRYGDIVECCGTDLKAGLDQTHVCWRRNSGFTSSGVAVV